MNRYLKLSLRFVVPVVCLLGVVEVQPYCPPVWRAIVGNLPCGFLAVLILTNLERGRQTAGITARAFPLGNFSMIAFLAVVRVTGSYDLGLPVRLALGYLAAAVMLTIVQRLGKGAAANTAIPARTSSAPIAAVRDVQREVLRRRRVRRSRQVVLPQRRPDRRTLRTRSPASRLPRCPNIKIKPATVGCNIGLSRRVESP